MKLEFKRWLTAPLRMSRKQALILIVLLVILGGALYLRLSVAFDRGLPTGKDGPYYLFHVRYLLEHYPSDPFLSDPPVFFHLTAWGSSLFSALGASLLTSYFIATALPLMIIIPTIFLMMRKLTKNSITALVAVFFSVFVVANVQMFAEFQKNALGVALVPLSVFFFWRGLEGGKKLALAMNLIIGGLALGVVGLTHELAFGTLTIAYISYPTFLLAYRRRIPWREIKAVVIVAISAVAVCGAFYYGRLSGLGGMAGGGSSSVAAMLAAEGSQSPMVSPSEQPINMLYDTFIGKLLLVLAAFGTGIAAYRRRPQDFFLLAWAMSSFLMAQSWVVQDYQWRFTLMLATPIALLAALGLVEGIGVLLWEGKRLRVFFGVGHSKKQDKLTWAGRAAFLGLLIFTAISQTYTSYNSAWTSPVLQPTITMEEYNAMLEFRENFGDVYVFGMGDKFHYWPDAVGLKGTIQAAGTVEPLSRALMALSESQDAMQLAVEWYGGEQQATEKIYAFESTAEPARVLENTDLFMCVFSQLSLRAYALKENFRPPENYPPPGPGESGFSLAAQPPLDNQQPPGGQQEGPQSQAQGEPLLLKILFAPIYALSGGMRFVIGVPLTVLLWVGLLCLVWEGVGRKISDRALEKLRKIIILVSVIVLVLTVLFFVGAPPGPPGGLPGPPPGLGSGSPLA